MKISTKGRYAVSIMLDLALDHTGDYITLKTIATRQKLSGKYLEQIISILNKARFVISTRGSQGGYKLSRPPQEYTIGMILRLLEGSLSPVPCFENNESLCGRQKFCVTFRVWKQLDDAISGVIDTITLQDLVDWQSEIDSSSERYGC